MVADALELIGHVIEREQIAQVARDGACVAIVTAMSRERRAASR